MLVWLSVVTCLAHRAYEVTPLIARALRALLALQRELRFLWCLKIANKF